MSLLPPLSFLLRTLMIKPSANSSKWKCFISLSTTTACCKIVSFDLLIKFVSTTLRNHLVRKMLSFLPATTVRRIVMIHQQSERSDRKRSEHQFPSSTSFIKKKRRRIPRQTKETRPDDLLHPDDKRLWRARKTQEKNTGEQWGI